jgi:uncharacterized membrane protein YvbJ
MVTCTKCGAKNEDEAKFCINCGANLHGEQKRYEKSRDECFGLPNSGAIAGIVFGILIIFWGLSTLFNWEINIMAILAIILGILIVAGAIRRSTRRRV